MGWDKRLCFSLQVKGDHVLQFIYISLEEMTAVADFINRRGRVSIAELAAKSNTFIDLEEKGGGQAELETLELDFNDDAEVSES